MRQLVEDAVFNAEHASADVPQHHRANGRPRGRRIGSAALVADGLHARTDGFTSLAVVAGALGVLAGFPLADPVVGVLVTVAILFVLRTAATDIGRRLMDAIDPAVRDTAETSLRSVNGVRDIEVLRLRWIGHRMQAEAAANVRRFMATFLWSRTWDRLSSGVPADVLRGAAVDNRAGQVGRRAPVASRTNSSAPSASR